MEPEIKVFKEFIRQRGLRNTRERETIAREILSRQDHFDVDELYLSLKDRGGVSKASIYRTIPLLIKAGLITEVFREDGHMHYEHIYGREHHCHLRCNNCRKVIEFSNPLLSEIEKEVGEKFGFAVTGHKLEIFGLCPECSQKKIAEST